QVNTDTRRPTLVPNALGGHDVIRFDGTEDLFCIDGTWSAMDGDEATWFVVAQSDFTTEQSLVRMNTSTGAARYGSLTKNTNGGEFISHSRTSAGGWVGANSTGAATSDYFVMSSQWAADDTISQWVFTENGSQISASASGATDTGGTFSSMRIATHNGSGTRLRGDIAEILVYGNDISTTERRDVEDYLYNKYFRNGGVESGVFTPGVRLHTTLDNADVNSTTVFDTEGAPQHGTIVGTVGSAAGQIAEARTFSGSDLNYVNFGDVLDPGAGSYTASLWFNASSTSGVQFIAGKGNANSGDVGWSIWMAGDDLYVRGQQNGGALGDRFGQWLPDALNPNEWYHVALVLNRDDNTIRGYLNGTNLGWTVGGGVTDLLVPGSTIDTTNWLILGRRWSAGAPFGGMLDDFIIWDRALSDSGILNLYNMGLEGQSYPYYPEPGTLTLLAFGGIGALVRRRRKRQA
ncbi:PEP-CTERM sorting domain-containing protein, partial [bacterium]|nr:PEP-CTERM sorting domain-containing protein [bacterium]